LHSYHTDLFLYTCYNRLTWQHTKDQTIEFPQRTLQPQTLHGWLTLHWEKESILNFLSSNSDAVNHAAIVKTDDTSNGKATNATVTLSSSFENTIEMTIQACSVATFAQSADGKSRRLRLANSNDVTTMARLVQGLADFEKESDAVHVTPDHYQMDGYQSEPRLFYCIFLEVLSSVDATTNSDDEEWYACGIAFFWIGCRENVTTGTNSNDTKESLFLYLEDLFIEESYRGNGAGIFIMKALGGIALSLQCTKMVWQALDWNTPALTFYQNKVGAHIVDGLLTTRFVGSSLTAFCDSD
jgi:GNAT superfamily N-acetyltransferase